MVGERESLSEKRQANTQLSSNLLKIIQKYQSIKVVQIYDSNGKTTKSYSVLLKIPLLYFRLPFLCSTLMFSLETAGL